jgi:hypothetical protein
MGRIVGDKKATDLAALAFGAKPYLFYLIVKEC